jgi:hypothetical protein
MGAEIPFDWILDEITGSDSTVTDYIMEARNARIADMRFTRRRSLSLPIERHVYRGPSWMRNSQY